MNMNGIDGITKKSKTLSEKVQDFLDGKEKMLLSLSFDGDFQTGLTTNFLVVEGKASGIIDALLGKRHYVFYERGNDSEFLEKVIKGGILL